MEENGEKGPQVNGFSLFSHALASYSGPLNELSDFSFLFFEVDKSGTFAPTYPPSKRKSDLRSSFLSVNQAIPFTWEVTILRRWTLKNDQFTW